jgi:hypothetical protein
MKKEMKKKMKTKKRAPIYLVRKDKQRRIALRKNGKNLLPSRPRYKNHRAINVNSMNGISE